MLNLSILNVTKMFNNREINIKRWITINQIVRSIMNLNLLFGISVTLIYVHLNHKRMQNCNQYQCLPIPFRIDPAVDFE